MGAVAAVMIGGAAALAAWIVFSIIPEAWRAARWPVTIVAAIMGALNGCTHFADTPLPTERVERELLASDRVGEMARAFRDSDPEAFDRYVRDLERAQREGVESDAMARAMNTLQTAAEPRIAFLPNEDVAAYYDLRRDEMLEFRDADATGCHPFFHGRASAAAPTSEALATRRMELYAKAFRTSGPSPHQPWTQAEWEFVLKDLQQRTLQIVGDDIALLASDVDVTGREARACEAIAEFYHQMAVSPQPGRVFVTLRPTI